MQSSTNQQALSHAADPERSYLAFTLYQLEKKEAGVTVSTPRLTLRSSTRCRCAFPVFSPTLTSRPNSGRASIDTRNLRLCTQR